MERNYFIGIDVGGTKIAAGLVDSKGNIFSRHKIDTPSQASAKEILRSIIQIIQDISKEENLQANGLNGIGVGIPGIVGNDNNHIVITPNINLSGIALASELKKSFPVNIAAGNDVNLGLLGEQWLGAAKKARNVVGLFPGTGIGGGIIINGELYTGTQGAAAEIGHMIIDLKGPKCSCGNYGCLEALASRWAIERDIRKAIKAGKKTKLKELIENPEAKIKSKFLKKALKQEDPLVTEIMKNTAEILGKACISIKHIFNPEMIVLGGGVIEACGDFLVPIIKKLVAQDPFFSNLGSCQIVESQLGDNAVILGAVCLVKKNILNSSVSPRRLNMANTF